MAKKTGYNPLALSAEGREGSGAAQIFQPYDAGKYERAKAEQTRDKAALDQKKATEKAKENKPDSYDFPKLEAVWSPYIEGVLKDYDALYSEYQDVYRQHFDNPDDIDVKMKMYEIKHKTDTLLAETKMINEAETVYNSLDKILIDDDGGVYDLDASRENLKKWASYDPEKSWQENLKMDMGGYDNILVFNPDVFDAKAWQDESIKLNDSQASVTESGGYNYDPDNAIMVNYHGKEKTYDKAQVKQNFINDYVQSYKQRRSGRFAGMPEWTREQLKEHDPNFNEDDWNAMSPIEQAKYAANNDKILSQGLGGGLISRKSRASTTGGSGADWKKNIVSEVASGDSEEIIKVKGLVAAEGDVDAFKKKLSENWLGAIFIDTEKYDNVPTYGKLKFGENPRLTTQTISDKVTVVTVTGNIDQADISSKALTSAKVLNVPVIWRYKDNNEIVSQEEIKNREEGKGSERDAYYEITVIAQGNADEQGTTRVTFMTPLESSTLLTNEQKEFAKELYSDEAIKEQFGYMYDDILP